MLILYNFHPGEREGGRGGEKEGREGREGWKGVPECPNPELASLDNLYLP